MIFIWLYTFVYIPMLYKSLNIKAPANSATLHCNVMSLTSVIGFVNACVKSD